MKNRFQNLPFKFQLAALHRGGSKILDMVGLFSFVCATTFIAALR
jgi:hypothetical protein